MSLSPIGHPRPVAAYGYGTAMNFDLWDATSGEFVVQAKHLTQTPQSPTVCCAENCEVAILCAMTIEH
jgi:hypothetical protein